MSPGPRLTRPVDRRQDTGLSFDPDGGQLALGRYSVTLPDGVDNRAVLEAYVDLAARGRGQRLIELVEVRQADVDALAAALDLDAADLSIQIESVLGASTAEALRMISRLRESRVIGGIARAAAGAVVASALVAGCSSPSPTGKADVTPAPTVEQTTEVDAPVTDAAGNPIIEDADGVGLIPPANADVEEVHLIPPAQLDRPTS